MVPAVHYGGGDDEPTDEINVQSIRFYERQGLLPPPPRTAAGYRMFSTDAVVRLRFIKRAQELGFTLKQIRELLRLRADDQATCSQMRHQVQEKLADVEGKIAQLQAMRKVLLDLAAACPAGGGMEDCPILKSLEEANPVPRSVA
jgi:Hg(II)-responsive transcriptional regulator